MMFIFLRILKGERFIFKILEEIMRKLLSLLVSLFLILLLFYGFSLNKEKTINDLQKSGYELIQKQSFNVSFENWGKVRLISGYCMDNNNNNNIPRLDLYLVN